MPPLDEPCCTPATRVRGSRTRWLRLCDHTLTDIETQPLNSGRVALLAIRLQPLLHSGSGTKDHAIRHAHQTLSHTRSPSLAHRHDQQAPDTRPPRGEGHGHNSHPPQTPCPTDPPAVIRAACAAALLGAAAFAHGMDPFHPIRVDHPEHRRSSYEDLRPGLTGLEEAQEPGALRELGKQRAIVAGQPPIQRAVAHARERVQQPHGAHLTGPEVRLGGCGEACQRVLDLTEAGCATMESGQRLLHV